MVIGQFLFFGLFGIAPPSAVYFQKAIHLQLNKTAITGRRSIILLEEAQLVQTAYKFNKSCTNGVLVLCGGTCAIVESVSTVTGVKTVEHCCRVNRNGLKVVLCVIMYFYFLLTP